MFGYAVKHHAKKADVEVTNDASLTPLMLSSKLGRNDIFKAIIEIKSIVSVDFSKGIGSQVVEVVSITRRDQESFFRPSATKSGRPYGVTSASLSLSWRTPPPLWLADPPWLATPPQVMDGWGARPLR